jgi:hypothetical protein
VHKPPRWQAGNVGKNELAANSAATSTQRLIDPATPYFMRVIQCIKKFQ